MAELNYDPDNGYVERYMFGSGFELHSVVGDLWTRFGIVGIVLSVTIAVILLAGAGASIANRSATALVVYVVVKTLWNIPFSPVYSAVPLLMLAVGLCLLPVHSPSTASRRRALGSISTASRTRRRHDVRDAH
jgi:hypothetical protein